MNNVIMIVGPGRSGTTFMYYLLQSLGFDCGDHPEFFRRYGREARRGQIKIPYIVKGTGGMCVNFDKYVEMYKLNVEHVIVCLRSLEAMVNSHAQFKKNSRLFLGMTEVEIKNQLNESLPATTGRLILHLLQGEYPFTIVKFPKSAQDQEYCSSVLQKVISLPDKDKFLGVWKETVVPNKIRFGG